MKNEYTPDNWILVRIESPKYKITKILSGWYGGYLDPDTWRLSSGVTSIEDHGTYYIIHNESGSVYNCRKSSEGFTNLSHTIYNGWLEQSKTSEISIKQIEVKDYEHI
jgi:hypothetical protein